MGLLILFVVSIITYIVYLQDAYSDADKTTKSKEMATKNNGIVYSQYGGGGTIKTKRLVSTGEKVEVDVFKNVTNKKGKVLFNLDDVYRQRLMEESKKRCKARGYKEFYIYALPWAESRNVIDAYGHHSPVCVETETGKLFKWYPKGKADEHIFEKRYQCKNGRPIKGDTWKFSIDIASDLEKMYVKMAQEVPYPNVY